MNGYRIEWDKKVERFGVDICDELKEEYDKILGLDKQNLKSVLVMPIGYRAKDDMFASFKKVRRPMEETIIEIKK